MLCLLTYLVSALPTRSTSFSLNFFHPQWWNVYWMNQFSLVVGIHFVLPWYDSSWLTGRKTSSIYLSCAKHFCVCCNLHMQGFPFFYNRAWSCGGWNLQEAEKWWGNGWNWPQRCACVGVACVSHWYVFVQSEVAGLILGENTVLKCLDYLSSSQIACFIQMIGVCVQQDMTLLYLSDYASFFFHTV